MKRDIIIIAEKPALPWIVVAPSAAGRSAGWLVGCRTSAVRRPGASHPSAASRLLPVSCVAVASSTGSLPRHGVQAGVAVAAHYRYSSLLSIFSTLMAATVMVLSNFPYFNQVKHRAC